MLVVTQSPFATSSNLFVLLTDAHVYTHVSNLIILFFSQGAKGPRGIKGAPGDRGQIGERVSAGDRRRKHTYAGRVPSSISPALRLSYVCVCVCVWICKCVSFLLLGRRWCCRKRHSRLPWLPGMCLLWLMHVMYDLSTPTFIYCMLTIFLSLFRVTLGPAGTLVSRYVLT